MLKKLQMQVATRRIKRNAANKVKAHNTRNTRRSAQKQTTLSKIREFIMRPCRACGRAINKIWQWICTRDLIGMINLTLLIAIIILFSMLIMNITYCKRAPRVYVSDVPEIAENTHPTRRMIKRPTRNVRATVQQNLTERQIPQSKNVMHGDVIIDNVIGASVLNTVDEIRGNLYLQNMRKYTLPCGIRIRGHLFLRDVNMLRFCGEFTVNGNIYVSPRSSFGPMPGTARLGGQVVL